MAAYNWIVFREACPKCGNDALIRAQCHVASSFDGDNTGRFCQREYRLGARMKWWDKSDDRYDTWKTTAGTVRPSPGNEDVVERCDADCPACGAELFALIGFRDITPANVLGLEQNCSAGN